MVLVEPTRVHVMPRPKDMPQSSDPDLPSKMDRSMRADLVVRPEDLLATSTPAPVPDSVLGLIPPQPKIDGVTVHTNPADRELVIKYKGQQVCWMKWLAANNEFVIKRVMQLVEGQKPTQINQYYGDLKEAWMVAGLYGVQPSEFQQTFRDMPSDIHWTFACCPWGGPPRVKCDLAYDEMEPGVRTNPDLNCRRCGARFATDDKGEVLIANYGKDPNGQMQAPINLQPGYHAPYQSTERAEERPIVEAGPFSHLARAPVPTQPMAAPAPGPAALTFEREVMRYRGMGETKVQQLVANGFTSWSAIADPQRQLILLNLPGLGADLAGLLMEVAREKAGG
jgi:hypothetical protein